VARIVDGATGGVRVDGTQDSEAAKVIPLHKHRIPPAPQPARAAQHRTWGRAAALMAASLVAGVVFGTADIAQPVLQQIADTLGIGAELDVLALSLDDEIPEFLDEDVL
jgi:hypothetical protein